MLRFILVNLAVLAFSILHAQDIAVVRDSIMQAYMESGFASKHFIPKGGHDKNNERQGKWKDYETKNESSFFVVKDESLEQFSNYLFYGEGEFSAGKRTGEWSIYIIEDKTFKKILSKKLYYTDGVPEGSLESFYPNGKLARTGNYVHGKLQDSSTVFYPDGEIFARRFYKNNEKEGEQDYFFKSGKLKYTVLYAAGIREGRAIKYYENGQLNEWSTYKADSLQGAYRYYYPDGKLWTERIYENGRLLNVTKLYGKDGNDLEKGTLKDGDGTVNFYSEEGKIYLTQTYKNGIAIKDEEK